MHEEIQASLEMVKNRKPKIAECVQEVSMLCHYRFDTIQKSLEEIKTSITNIEKTLHYGNGKPALVHRVDSLEECHNLIKEKQSKNWMVITLIIAACLSVIIPKIFHVLGLATATII